jgi:hypothetical protein
MKIYILIGMIILILVLITSTFFINDLILSKLMVSLSFIVALLIFKLLGVTKYTS